MQRGSLRAALGLAAVTALVLILSGCPSGGGGSSDPGGGYHLHA
jgi:hypothetical protein